MNSNLRTSNLPKKPPKQQLTPLDMIYKLLSEQFTIQRLFMSHTWYIMYRIALDLVLLLILAFVIVIFVNQRDTDSMIDVTLDMFDEISEALEMILMNTMVPPMPITRGIHAPRSNQNTNLSPQDNLFKSSPFPETDAFKKWVQTSQPDYIKKINRALLGLQAIRNVTKAYFSKNGRKSTLEKEDGRINYLRQRYERLATRSSPSKLESSREATGSNTNNNEELPLPSIFDKIDGKTGSLLIQKFRALNEEPAHETSPLFDLYEKIDGTTQSSPDLYNHFEDLSSQAQNDVAPASAQTLDAHTQPTQTNKLQPASSTTQGGGVGYAVGSLIRNAKAKDSCLPEDNLLPVFNASNIGDLTYFQNVSVPCSIRHLAYSMDFLFWLIIQE